MIPTQGNGAACACVCAAMALFTLCPTLVKDLLHRNASIKALEVSRHAEFRRNSDAGQSPDDVIALSSHSFVHTRLSHEEVMVSCFSTLLHSSRHLQSNTTKV